MKNSARSQAECLVNSGMSHWKQKKEETGSPGTEKTRKRGTGLAGVSGFFRAGGADLKNRVDRSEGENDGVIQRRQKRAKTASSTVIPRNWETARGKQLGRKKSY